MKILFVHDRFGAQAGAESNLFHTAVALKGLGHELSIAHGQGTGKEESNWGEVFTHCYRLSHDSIVPDFAEAMATVSPDMVYLHNSPDPSLITFLADARTPVVRMVHDHKLFCLRGCKYTPWSRRPCERALGAYCVFPCGGVLARSSGSRRSFDWVSYRQKQRELSDHKKFERLIVASNYMKLELLRNGVEASRIEVHPPVPPPVKIAVEPSFSDVNRLVYAGQIARGKGVDVLLRALAKVQTPFECIILGEGHHRAYCEALSRRLNLTGRVIFRGYVPQAELTSIYASASLAVISSVWAEPFGATGLEAMRCGLPVVAFDTGGIKDWLQDGENGFLVRWKDHRRFAECVEVLLQDKVLARRLGTQGQRLAAEKFDFRRYVDGLENLFENVGQGNREVCA
ncbi:MAG: glycosyltransferase family 4 protein [Opitutales bacterium]|nr:glycosyltransferase family 4 protein [Opitutales bacterium]MCH8539779.1 glycosyltransferase family 4 protein [Opitutales bacterium]